jgi:hypothetical protein
MWNPKRDGELVFFRGQVALSVSVETAPALSVSAPRTLFKSSVMIPSARFRSVDISRDGSRIAMVVPLEDPRELEIRVILNWFEELKAKAPTGR